MASFREQLFTLAAAVCLLVGCQSSPSGSEDGSGGGTIAPSENTLDLAKLDVSWLGIPPVEVPPETAEQIEEFRMESQKGMDVAVNTTADRLNEAAIAPLEDVGFYQVEIPSVIDQIEDPYEDVSGWTCDMIAVAVVDLNGVLGFDFDEHTIDTRSQGEKTGEDLSDYAIIAATSATRSFIPYRSLVRQVSGAAAREAAFRKAMARATARRAYLKGRGMEMGCAYPAAPMDSQAPPSASDG